MSFFSGKRRFQSSSSTSADRARLRVERTRRLKLEPLEERHLLSATSPTGDAYSNAIKYGPYVRGGEALYQIMNQHGGAAGGVADTSTQGMGGSAAADYAQRYLFDGDSVQLYLRSNGNFASFQQELAKLGVDLGPSDASLQVVQADVPYSKIDAVAALPQIVSMNPIGRATTHSQGRAVNQADISMRGETLRLATQVTGAGQTVGVLSDSVSQVGNGLLDSYNTLDLPGNVAVIEDFPTGTDEGRAMLELIHDIAPNAGLAFATAFTGQLGFAQNIDAAAHDRRRDGDCRRRVLFCGTVLPTWCDRSGDQARRRCQYSLLQFRR